MEYNSDAILRCSKIPTHKEIKIYNKREIVSLINYEPNSQVAIYFAELKNPGESDPLKAILKKMNFVLVEEKPCKVLDQSYQWVIGKFKEDEEEKYREDIFLNSHNIYISYQGPNDKRSYLDQAVSSPQKKPLFKTIVKSNPLA
jgi:hypothetical protein